MKDIIYLSFDEKKVLKMSKTKPKNNYSIKLNVTVPNSFFMLEADVDVQENNINSKTKTQMKSDPFQEFFEAVLSPGEKNNV